MVPPGQLCVSVCTRACLSSFSPAPFCPFCPSYPFIVFLFPFYPFTPLSCLCLYFHICFFAICFFFCFFCLVVFLFVFCLILIVFFALLVFLKKMSKMWGKSSPIKMTISSGKYACFFVVISFFHPSRSLRSCNLRTSAHCLGCFLSSFLDFLLELNVCIILAFLILDFLDFDFDFDFSTLSCYFYPDCFFWVVVVLAVAIVVVVVLTLTHKTMQSVVAGQAPITL